jgi:hypothetical protein
MQGSVQETAAPAAFARAAGVSLVAYVPHVLLAGLALGGAVIPVLRTPERIPFNYNEGVVAYLAQRILLGEPLYPPIESWLTNNYPPLHYYLLALLSPLEPDLVIAGRWLSWAGFVAVAVTLAWIARTLGASRGAAAFASLLWVGTMLCNFDAYLGMNDPQLVANALLLGGLGVALRPPHTHARLALAALLMAAGGLCKFTEIAIPLAFTIWLLLVDRRTLARWLSVALPVLAAGVALVWALYGEVAFEAVLTSRELAPWTFVYGWGHSMRLQIPAVATLVLVLLWPRERAVVLVALHAAIATLLALAMSAVEGANYNRLFDSLMAFSLASALLLDRVARAAAEHGRPVALARAIAGLVLSAPVLVGAPRAWHDAAHLLFRVDWIAASAATSRDDISFLASKPSPVFCERVSLCYWAGQPYVFEPYNWRHKVEAKRASEKELLEAIAGGRFHAVQLEASHPERSPRFTDEVHAELLRSYVEERKSSNGVFLSPRVPRATGLP